jgi:hypothetical protein
MIRFVFVAYSLTRSKLWVIFGPPASPSLLTSPPLVYFSHLSPLSLLKVFSTPLSKNYEAEYRIPCGDTEFANVTTHRRRATAAA